MTGNIEGIHVVRSGYMKYKIFTKGQNIIRLVEIYQHSKLVSQTNPESVDDVTVTD